MSQIPLFNFGVDIAQLKRAREVLLTAGKARNTEYGYKLAWKWFTQWCTEASRTALPATEETLELYLTHLLEHAERGPRTNGKLLRVRAIRVKLCAIQHYHVAAGYSSPFGETARALLSNGARLRQERPNQKAALPPGHLRDMLALLSRDRRPKAARDAALVLLGFALGWRRSEICSLSLSDVTFVKDKGILVSLGASKTDQEANGRRVSVPFGSNPETCPVRKLEAWLEIRGREPGALFCTVQRWGLRPRNRNHLSSRTVWALFKDLIRRIGADPLLYSPHSLRAGFVTAAYLAGANEKSIMARTGHRSAQTVLNYVRPLEGFRSDPLKNIL